MKLIRLKGVNFRQHRLTEIEFGRGITAIAGRNGAGKSTILEMITFALFGEQRGNKGTILFHGATTKKYSAELEFEVDGSRLQVMRSSDTAEFVDLSGSKPLVLATGLANVTEAVEKRLGLTFEQFTNSFCALQKGLGFLNFRNNADRQREVARMLGYDRLQKAEELARERTRSVKERIGILIGTLGDPEQLTSDLATAKGTLSEVGEEIGTNERAVADLEGHKEEITARAEEADRYDRLSREMGEISAGAAALKEAKRAAEAEQSAAKADVERRTAIEADADEFTKVEERVKEGERAKEAARERSQLQETINGIRADIVTTEKRLAAIEVPDIAQLENTETREALTLKLLRDGWVNERSLATKELATAQAELRHARESLTKAQDAIKAGKCPTCGQPYGESFMEEAERLGSLVVDIAQKVKTAEERAGALEPLQIAVAEQALESTLDEIKSAKEARSEHDGLKTVLDGQRQRLKDHEARLSTSAPPFDEKAHTELVKRRDELAPIAKEHRDLVGAPARLARAVTGLETCSRKVDEASQSWNEKKQAKDALGFASPEDAVAAVNAHDEMRALTVRLAAERRQLDFRRSEAARAVEQAENRLTELKKRLAEIKSAEQERTLNETLATELRTLRLELNASIGPELASRASENLSLLTNGRYPVLALDGTFAASVVDEGVTKTVLSGGEEDVKDLALRLALAEIIQERQGRPLSLLILDEVWGSLDAERRHSVLERLIALRGRFEQILIISHIEGINEVAANCIWLARDPETGATITTDEVTAASLEVA